MGTRALGPGAGIGWLKNGVNLGRRNPKAIFGGVALMILAFALPIAVFCLAIAGMDVAKPGSAGFFWTILILVLAFIPLMSAFAVGFLRLIDKVENERPARASDVFAAFRDPGAVLRVIGLIIVLAVTQYLLLGLMLGALAPGFGSWYLHNLQASMHGTPQGNAGLPSGFGLGISIAWLVGLVFNAVHALGLGQIALGGRGVFRAVGDGVVGAMKNLLPLLVMFLTLVAAMIVLALALILLVMAVALLSKLLGAWLIVVIAIPLYLAFALAMYVVMFGVMYYMWRDICGDDSPFAGSARRPVAGLMKNLTSQQLAVAACGALLVAGVLLSHDNRMGFALLALAVACGIGAFAKSKNR